MGSAPPERRLGGAFWRLWTASTISNLGDGIDLAALPLLAAALTRDPVLVAGLATAARLPWLLFALTAGALVDRTDRRRLMVAVNVVRGGLVAVIAVSAATGTTSIWLLYVVSFLLGVNETLFDNAAQSLLPAIVAPALLETANGRQQAAEMVANTFAGPPLGSILFSLTVSAPFWADSASFIIAAALIATIAGSFKPIRAGDQPRRKLRTDVAEGIRWLHGQRLLRTLAILLGVANLAQSLWLATFVLFAQDDLGLSDRGYGFLLAAMAVGGVVGGVLSGRITRVLGPAPALLGCLVVDGVVTIAMGLCSSAWAVAALSVLSGVFIVTWNVITVSLRQRIIPDHLFGRVNSVYRFIGWGAIPIGAILGGILADAFGLRSTFFVGGAVVLVALIPAWSRITPAEIAAAEAR
ncbi:MAG TPA: MFS transporter [Acidimicrobiales bacterium]